MQVFIRPVLDSNQLKLQYTPSYSPTHREFENYCFISVAPMVYVSHAFVYEAVDVNKIIAVSSTKPPSYAYAQVTARQTFALVDLPIYGEHCKPNSNFVD